MGQDPIVESTSQHADPAELRQQQQIESDGNETQRFIATSAADAPGKIDLNERSVATADIPGASGEPAPSSVAEVLIGDYPTFIDALLRVVKGDVTPAAHRALHLAARPTPNEAAAFERLVDFAIDHTKSSVAAKICAALAARTAGLAVRRANGNVDAADGSNLFTAWLETARAIAAARGCAGLERLVPAARLFARKSAEHSRSAAEIASTMRRIAERILDELSLEPAPGSRAPRQEHDLARRRTLSPPGIISNSPMLATPHPR
jgi:hypothetical protein